MHVSMASCSLGFLANETDLLGYQIMQHCMRSTLLACSSHLESRSRQLVAPKLAILRSRHAIIWNLLTRRSATGRYILDTAIIDWLEQMDPKFA